MVKIEIREISSSIIDYFFNRTIERAIKIEPNLGQEVNPLIKDLKKNLENLKESLSKFFINK
ncbi:MAG: hypothetical protein ACFFDN_19845 [Candidatus Hodarchaeota archaeon]